MTTSRLERVYSDIAGPMKTKSLERATYFLTLLDSHTGYSLVRFIHHNVEAANEVLEMLTEIENLCNSRVRKMSFVNRKNIKWMRTDGGGECIGSIFQRWLRIRGIVHQGTTAYYSESNRNAAQLNWTPLDMVRPFFLLNMQSNYNNVTMKHLWVEAVSTARFFRNHVMTKICKGRCTWYQIVHGKKQNLHFVKVFRNQAFVYKRKERSDCKLKPRAAEGILLGFCNGTSIRSHFWTIKRWMNHRM